jgi:dTDP-4-dehydrorhamnose reductase
MRIAITGTTGRVGAALAGHLAACHEVIPLRRADLDLTDMRALDAVLAGLDCDVFIHPAAITSLEACEDDPRLAMRVNSAAPGRIALWAAERGVRMIHFSTDYVFGGDGVTPLTEEMPARPVNAYGRSKLAGEQAVLAHPGHLVIRVSWVFGPEKPSFVDQVIDDARAGRPLAAVADKFSLPCCTEDLAQWTGWLIDRGTCGIIHACNPGGPVSWHGLATAVVREMHACGVLAGCPPIAELQLATMAAFRARRPRFTVMDTARLAALAGGRRLRPWPEALAAHVRARCGV